jgi:hypothetical protein
MLIVVFALDDTASPNKRSFQELLTVTAADG